MSCLSALSSLYGKGHLLQGKRGPERIACVFPCGAESASPPLMAAFGLCNFEWQQIKELHCCLSLQPVYICWVFVKSINRMSKGEKYF